MIKKILLGIGLALLVQSSSAASCNRTDEYSGDYVERWEFCDDDLHRKHIPQFKAFPAARLPALKLRLPTRFEGSDPEDAAAWMEAIHSASKDRGALFAGHYLFVQRGGCGNGCHRAVIVDLRNGNIFMPDLLDMVFATVNSLPASMCEKLGIDCLSTMNVQPDSKLIVVIGQFGEDSERRGLYFYKWDDDRLTLVSKIDKPRG